MKDKIFGVLQRVGRSFMLPIALLPVAGLLLGIGSSFTNETMLAAYGLNSVIHPGTLIYTILDVMSQTGNAVFSNLALLFAMGVSMVLSSLSVYFRDVTHLYSVVTLAWMYVTPVFYPVSALPDEVAWVLKLNPMYYYLDNFRQLVLYGSLPTAKSWCICLLCSGVALAVGLAVFRKLQRNFILYL